MRWVAGVAVVVALAAAACSNPDTPSGEGPERRGGGGAESAVTVEAPRSDNDAGEEVKSARRASASASGESAGVSDGPAGSVGSGGGRVEVPVSVEQGGPGEETAGGDVVPVFVELPGLVEAAAEAGRLSGLLSVISLVWCGLRADGSVACRESLSLRERELPEGPFVALTTGWGFQCGLGADGSVECWGHGSTDAPEGVFSAISSGGYRSCGLRPGGGLACWARPREVLSGSFAPLVDLSLPEEFLARATEHPGGVFGAVSVGFGHVCGLRVDGSVECWGEDWFGQSSQAPAGAFVAVDAGVSHSCGVRPDGSAECWGEDSMDSGFLGTMEFRYEGGEQEYLDLYGPRVREGAPRELDFMTIEGAVFDAALIGEMVQRAAGWEPPPGPFKAVSAGAGFTCGLRLDGEVECWGYVADEEPRIPLTVYAEVVGERVAELYATAQAEVGGDETTGAPSPTRAGAEQGADDTTSGGPDAEVAAAAARAAGVGSGTFSFMLGHVDLMNPPSGPFVAIDTGLRQACGLRSDGEVVCWGDDYSEFLDDYSELFDSEELSRSPPPGPLATEALVLRIAAGAGGDDAAGDADSAAGAVSGNVGGVEGFWDDGDVHEGLFARPLERSGPSCGGVLVPGGRLEWLIHPDSRGKRTPYYGPWVSGGKVELWTLLLRPNSTVRLWVVGGRVPRGGESVEDGSLLPRELPAAQADPEGFLSTTWRVPEAPVGHDGPMWYRVTAQAELILTHQELDLRLPVPILAYPDVAPCAVADEATTTVDRPVRIDVLANDIAPTGGTLDPATVTVISAWDGDFVVDLADGSLTFTPEAGFVGTARGNYIVYDSWNVGAPARVTVTVAQQ